MNLIWILLSFALGYHPAKDSLEVEKAVEQFGSMAVLFTKGIITPELRNMTA